MTKFQLLKAFITNVRVKEFVNILWFMFKNYAEKQYLQDSTLVDELEETFNRVDKSTRPLSNQFVEKLDKLAFTELELKNDSAIGVNHYYEAKPEDAR